MDVSIIFINYNTINLLIDAIDSVIEKTRNIIYEIIVVDNASNDDSHRLLKDRFGAGIRYLSLTTNIGFGRANNEGMMMAQGRNVFLLNPDTLLENNAVKILSDYLDSNRKVGVAGANLYNEDGSNQPSFSYVYPSLGFELSNLFHFLFLYNRETSNNTNNIKTVKRVVGAAMMIRKSLIDEIGGFDPRFFMYAEEDELCNRIRKAGYRIVNVPNAHIIHLDGRSFQFTEQRQILRLKGLRTLYRISYSPIYCKLLRIVEYLTIISRLATAIILTDTEKKKFWMFMYHNRKWE